MIRRRTVENGRFVLFGAQRFAVDERVQTAVVGRRADEEFAVCDEQKESFTNNNSNHKQQQPEQQQQSILNYGHRQTSRVPLAFN